MLGQKQANLERMLANAQAEIERIEGLRRDLLSTLTENGTQQIAILAQTGQANDALDQAQSTLQDARKRVQKRRARAAIAVGTDQEADQASKLAQAIADRDAALAALQVARQSKQDADAQLAGLQSLNDDEASIRDQLSDLAGEREEDIVARDEIAQKLASVIAAPTK